MPFKSLLSLMCLLGSANVLAQTEIHLAYESVRPDTVPISYAHDSLIKSMSVTPLIGSDELISARVGVTKGDAFLEIHITEPALFKINRVAQANIRMLNAKTSGDVVSLAIVVDGKVQEVINGTVHTLDNPTVRVSSAGGASDELIQSWQAIADAINRRKVISESADR